MLDTVSLVSLWMPNGSLQKLLESHDERLNAVHRLQLVYLFHLSDFYIF